MDPIESAKAQAAMLRALADSMARKQDDAEFGEVADVLIFVNAWTEAVEQAVANLIEHATKNAH